MLCLCGFELYSRRVPLIMVLNGYHASNNMHIILQIQCKIPIIRYINVTAYLVLHDFSWRLRCVYKLFIPIIT